MAFVVEKETKYTPSLKLIRHVYPAIKIAETEMRMDRAAREYWQKYQDSGELEQAIAVAQGILTHDELESDEFKHILWKRRP
jgi:transcription elongation factor GreA-like protein